MMMMMDSPKNAQNKKNQYDRVVMAMTTTMTDNKRSMLAAGIPMTSNYDSQLRNTTTAAATTTTSTATSRTTRTISYQMIASWFAFLMVMTQMLTFHGGDWTSRALQIDNQQTTLSEDESTSADREFLGDAYGVDDVAAEPLMEESTETDETTVKEVDDSRSTNAISTHPERVVVEVVTEESSVDATEVDESRELHDRRKVPRQEDIVQLEATTQNHTTIINPLHCSKNSEGITSCCGDWNTNADDWWLHNVDWEVTFENETTYCFSKMKNERKAETFRRIHHVQWFSGRCDEVVTTWLINSGYGASIGWLSQAFMKARKEGKPFQINSGGASKKVRPPEHQHPWLYGPKDESSWAWCPERDHSCYFLPLSSCPREISRQERQWAYPDSNDDWQWQKEYMMRPKTIMRKKLFEMKRSLKLPTPNCVTMHVRRADAGFPSHPYRRYAAVQEYLDAAQVGEGANIFLLTDDNSTIEEIHEHHPNYNWFYFDRPRNKGVEGGWEGHIPSGKPEFELLTIFAEHDLASRCEKVVHGKSSFITVLFGKMDMLGRKYERYEVKTAVSKQEAMKWPKDGKARVDYFANEMAEYRRKSKEAKIIKSGNKQHIGSTADDVKHKKDNAYDSLESASGLTRQSTHNHTVLVNPLRCSKNSKGITSCCGDWNTDADDWWLHNVDWEVTLENETSYCFSKMKNEKKADFFRTLHHLQWFSGKCHEARTTWQINSGFGASTSWLAKTFLKARQEGRPFQINTGGASKKIRPPELQHPWLYGPKDNSSWAWCPERDITCYFLPISSCPREMTRQEHQWASPGKDLESMLDFEWEKEYMMRPKTIMRKKLFEMKRSLSLPTPKCVTMHVRRADAGFPSHPYRRYAAVQEYLDAAQVEEGANIMLLTDDNSTIEEIHEHHPNYNWVYMDRPRNKGVEGGWEGHIPSGKPEFEILTIFAEIDLASRCEKVVNGQSGFMKVLFGKMDMEGRKYERYEVDTAMSKAEAMKWPKDGKARLEHFQKEMAEYRRRSKESKLPKILEDKDNSGTTEERSDQGSVDSKGLVPSRIPQNEAMLVDPLYCSKNSEGITSCCGDWNTNADDWWLHHPDWEVTLENATSYCFSKMKNEKKADFFRTLHHLQWFSGKCNETMTAWQINSGFGASTSWLSYTFLKARQEGRPFQINTGGASKKVRPPELQHPWLYGPKDNSSWAWCPERDISCYFLPISSCPREITRQERHYASPGDDIESIVDFEWQKEYMMRPKTIMRKKLFEMKQSLNLPTPNCVTMHVRRGDAGLPRRPYRRYAAVQEYLDAAEVEEGANIMLLTDDKSTIEEIHEHHPNYNWVYMDRPRNKGVDGGWEGHIPSGVPEFEILTIFAEIDLASRCEKVVQGQSGFMEVLIGKMDMEGRKYNRYKIQTGVSPEEALKWPKDGNDRLEHFQKEMAEYRRKSREAKLSKSLQ